MTRVRTLAALALVAVATSAQAATDYPPDKSPQIDADHPAKRWTHMPDGRWMFVDPDQKMCDFEHHCYDAGAPTTPAAPAPQTLAPTPEPELAPDLAPSPMADSLMCEAIRHRLFQSWHELQQAHRLCGP